MSRPAEKTADMSAEPAAQSRPHRTRGPRLLLTTSEHAQLSKMAKRHRRPPDRPSTDADVRIAGYRLT
ncbi:MAG: hypothetical protein F4X29_07185, partial [Rhodothermaceae bacterium]|nr:hypothetical protein [Rhodothermaceae bacterium]